VKRTVIALVVVCIVAIAVVAVYRLLVPSPASPGSAGGARGGPPGGFAMAVEATPVRVGEMRRTTVAVGSLVANEMVVVRPEIAGRITQIVFREGQLVCRGDLLIQLDDSVERAELAQAQASLALSRANYERAETLVRSGSGTTRALDEARFKLKNDEAAVGVATARIGKMRMEAPFSGTIGLRRVSTGDYVAPGTDIANLAMLDPLKVDFRVPEIYLTAIAVGQTVGIEIDSFPNRVFPGEIYAIDPLIDPAGRAIVLHARIANQDGVLRPGLFARVTVMLLARADALFVPEQAIVPLGDRTVVYRIKDGVADEVSVRIGERLGTEVEIVGGLARGDQIVTAGQLKIGAGMPVRNVATADAAAAAPRP